MISQLEIVLLETGSNKLKPQTKSRVVFRHRKYVVPKYGVSSSFLCAKSGDFGDPVVVDFRKRYGALDSRKCSMSDVTRTDGIYNRLGKILPCIVK